MCNQQCNDVRREAPSNKHSNAQAAPVSCNMRARNLEIRKPTVTMTTTIYRARRILTMNPSNPEATHVAVQGDRILGAGTVEELAGWGEHQLDERFADKVLMPGLVEGHSHERTGKYRERLIARRLEQLAFELLHQSP